MMDSYWIDLPFYTKSLYGWVLVFLLCFLPIMWLATTIPGAREPIHLHSELPVLPIIHKQMDSMCLSALDRVYVCF